MHFVCGHIEDCPKALGIFARKGNGPKLEVLVGVLSWAMSSADYRVVETGTVPGYIDPADLGVLDCPLDRVMVGETEQGAYSVTATVGDQDGLEICPIAVRAPGSMLIYLRPAIGPMVVAVLIPLALVAILVVLGVLGPASLRSTSNSTLRGHLRLIHFRVRCSWCSLVAPSCGPSIPALLRPTILLHVDRIGQHVLFRPWHLFRSADVVLKPVPLPGF
eukprot:6459048-Amphidinium_carterae.1